MILIFADDSTMIAVDDISEANRYCELIDVENGEYTFLNEHATLLRPLVPKSVRRFLGLFISSSAFSLLPTEERRPELLKAVFDGLVTVDAGPRIRTRDELIRELEKFKR